MGISGWLLGKRSRYRYIDAERELRKVRTLAEGGFARTELVLHTRTGTFYVAKRSIHAGKGPKEEIYDLEAELIKAISVDHPNVARAYPYYYELPDGSVYILTEFYEGPSISSLYENLTYPLGPAQIASIGAQAARGLQAIHDADLIHGDISPNNILVSQGQARIIDFGLASSASAAVTRTAMGTPGFLAPEAGFKRPTDRSDIFSLGLVLYHLWRLKLPQELDFFGRSAYSLDLYFSRPTCSLEQQLIETLRLCTAVDPKKRLRSARSMARRLSRVARECPPDWWEQLEQQLYRENRYLCGVCESPLPTYAVYCPRCGEGPFKPRGEVKLVPVDMVPLPCRRCHAFNSTRWSHCHLCGQGLHPKRRALRSG